MASKTVIRPIAQVYRNSHEYWIRGLHGRAIMSRKQFILVLSQATCRGSKPSIQSRGNSEYPTLQPNKAPATVALHVAWPPCIASSVIAVLFIWKKYIYIEKTKQTNKHKTTTTKNNYKKTTTNKQTNKLKFVSYQLGFLIKLWLAWIICDYFKFIFKHTTPGPRN